MRIGRRLRAGIAVFTAIAFGPGLNSANAVNESPPTASQEITSLEYAQMPCFIPTELSSSLPDRIPYRAGIPGLRLKNKFGYLQIVNTESNHVVNVFNAIRRKSEWVEGIFPYRNIENIEKLHSDLWPLRSGKVIHFSDRTNQIVNQHEVTVGVKDSVAIGGKHVPVIWIDDRVSAEGKDEKTVLVSHAYAPDLGFVATRNYIGSSMGQAWPTTTFDTCPRQSKDLFGETTDEVRARVKQGDVDAMVELGKRLSTGRLGTTVDLGIGAALLERAANAGNAEAQALIGAAYLNGSGVQKNVETAIAWWKKSAEQRFPLGEIYLARVFYDGTLITRDADRAFQLFDDASSQGDATGKLWLALMYLRGTGTQKNTDIAIQLYKEAANKANWEAMSALGQLYRNGAGVPVDLVVAYAWNELAISYAASIKDRTLGISVRNDLELVLSPSDVQRAQQLALHWHPGVDFAALTTNATDKTATRTNSKPDSAKTGVATGSASKEDAAGGSELPVIEKHRTFDIDVHPDASSDTIEHIEMTALNQTAASGLAQVPVRYREKISEIDLVEAYTLKADGRKLSIDPAAVYSQLVPGTPNVPMFDDQKQKVLVFPSVESGDSIVYTIHSKSKPLIPGVYSFAMFYFREFKEDDVRLTVTTPKNLPLKTEAFETQLKTREKGDKLIYEWRYANTNPVKENLIALAPIDRLPRMAGSTSQSWDAFAAAYADLVTPMMTVTPKLQALADEITAGVSDRRGQAERIYDWVSHHIRYVGVELGNAAVIPHSAETILANGYGDCKDHSVLFATLLAAKNIKSEMVLINLGNSYSLVSTPSFANLNHAISWLPEFGIFADTTATVAPFGVLPFAEYGKPIVYAIKDGSAVGSIPSLAPGEAEYLAKTTAKMGNDGKIVGDTVVSAIGPYLVALRQTMTKIESMGNSEAAQMFLKATNADGTGHFEKFAPFDASNNSLGGHFESLGTSQSLTGSSFHMPIGLSVLGVPGASLMGPTNATRLSSKEPTPCISGHEVQEISLELPKGKRLRELPQKNEIATDNLNYRSEWAYKNGVVTLHREFISHIATPTCSGQVREATANALNQIRRDYNTSIALVNE